LAAAAPAIGLANQGSGFGAAPAPNYIYGNAFGAPSFNAAPASGGFSAYGFGVCAAPASFNAGGMVGFQSQTYGAQPAFSKSAGDKGDVVQSICAKMMDRSLESQRFEDYSTGNTGKGGQQGFGMAVAGGATTPFPQQAPSFLPATCYYYGFQTGQQQTMPTPFGAQPLFSQYVPTPPAFSAQGFCSQYVPTVGATGRECAGFGVQLGAQGASGFGQAALESAFGAPAQQGGFGATAPLAPAAGPLFHIYSTSVAAPATTLFGAPASSSGGIFANLGGIGGIGAATHAPSAGLFVAPQPPGFFAQQPSSQFFSGAIEGSETRRPGQTIELKYVCLQRAVAAESCREDQVLTSSSEAAVPLKGPLYSHRFHWMIKLLHCAHDLPVRTTQVRAAAVSLQAD
jgi:hypothetical protein